MTDETTSLTVTQLVPVSANRLFAVLIDPARHAEIDGSETVRSAASTDVVTKVTDVFTMNMNQPAFGEYQSDNHVVEFEQDRRIAWTPALAGSDPLGHVWRWELEPEGGSSTRVSQTCDWSAVTDERVLAALGFPRISGDQMGTTIERLARAAS